MYRHIVFLIVPLVASALNISAYNETDCYYPDSTLTLSEKRSHDIPCELAPLNGAERPPTLCCPPDYECRQEGLCMFPNNETVVNDANNSILKPNSTWRRDDSVVWVAAPSCSDPDWGCSCNGKPCFNGTKFDEYFDYRKGFLPQKSCADLQFLEGTTRSTDWFKACSQVKVLTAARLLKRNWTGGGHLGP